MGYRIFSGGGGGRGVVRLMGYWRRYPGVLGRKLVNFLKLELTRCRMFRPRINGLCDIQTPSPLLLMGPHNSIMQAVA